MQRKQPKIQVRVKSQEEKAKNKADREEMLGVFMDIWHKRKHICYETGEFLGKEPLTIYFSHILPKDKYPQYKNCEWNIVLMSQTSHDQWGKDMEKCPKMYKLYLELLDKHHNFVNNKI